MFITGSIVILRLVLPVFMNQHPKRRTADDLYIGQIAHQENRRVKQERDKAIAERDKAYEIIRRWGVDPVTGDYTPTRMGNNKRAELNSLMVQWLNEDDLLDICFQMNIDHEILKDGNKRELVRSLLDKVENTSRQRELSVYLTTTNPSVDWPQYW